MPSTRYTQWDGSQSRRINAERVFEKLSELMSFTDDVQQALDWLTRQGLEIEGDRLSGLDELLEQVRQEIRKRLRDFNLKDATSSMERKLEELLDREQRTLEQIEPGDPQRAGQKRQQLARVPRRLSEAIRKLESYEFDDSSARESFEELLEEYDNIRDLENFRERFGQMFHGTKSLSYEEALELMREMEALKGLEQELMAGNFQAVDPDKLQEMMGGQAAQNFESLRQLSTALSEAGYLMQKSEHMALSPKGVRRIGQLALRDIYQGLLRDRAGSHQVDHRGLAEMRQDQIKPWRFGEPLNLDLVATLKQSLSRGGSVPLRLEPGDFQAFVNDYGTSSSTVLCLDMSWSMSWEGRFAAAKKVAMAMETLIRTRFPRDYFSIVGFFTRAVELKIKDLPEASWNMGDPFTNLQDGLHLASRLLGRHPAKNQHIIVITDGQPTAYFLKRRLYCEWPLSFGGISVRAAQETLKEVERVTRRGITINTFMLDDSPSLRAFVEKMTQINRGRALYTRPDHLGEYLLVDYLARRRKHV